MIVAGMTLVLALAPICARDGTDSGSYAIVATAPGIFKSTRSSPLGFLQRRARGVLKKVAFAQVHVPRQILPESVEVQVV